ncbi:MAG: PBSX family phage terminase large subunit, partial [Candidatus Peribacteraceae bacterium]|nr:PBSX family phage terminase large subunit [Candidatus Peribacteraceae bacterium]
MFKAQDTIMDIMKGGRNYLVVRQVYSTLEESFYNELLKVIDSFCLGEFFTCKKSHLKITCSNGYQILFRGLDKVDKVKSITPIKGTITDVLIEEATEISKKDYLTLTTRLRGKAKGIKKRIHLLFNPVLASHWIRKMFFKGVNEELHNTKKLLIVKSTHVNNDFLEKEDHERYEEYKDIDDYMYQVYTLGKWGVLKGLIFNTKNWRISDL